jgi:hypothetical protein
LGAVGGFVEGDLVGGELEGAGDVLAFGCHGAGSVAQRVLLTTEAKRHRGFFFSSADGADVFHLVQ